MQGRPVPVDNEAQRARLRLTHLGFVFQFHFLLTEFTSLMNVMLPMRALGKISEAQMKDRALALLASLGLEAHAHKLPGQLSGGQRQRVAIARALANEPHVILADEPTGNLDSQSSEQVLGVLRRLVDETKRSIVMVTHDLGLAPRADRQLRIVDGRISNDIT